MNDWMTSVIYLLPLAMVLALYLARQRRRDREGTAAWNATLAAGLTEPPSLHSVVNRSLCLGSGACITACPEEALGIVRGKAHLVNPSVCIGHGACVATCPSEAISLVWGTLRRGVEIPYVKPNFETNVPGLYIAGELGGMGLIRKAAEQGRQAIEAIVAGRTRGGELDVVIVGAGPAGIAATLAAMEHKLAFTTIEQETSLGGTVYHYPRHKVVMTQPVKLPLVGMAHLKEVQKEALLAFWEDILARFRVPIRFGERLEQMRRDDAGFVIRTTRGEMRTRNVLLAIGRRGTPRTLGVEGEDLPKVVYRLVDANQYEGKQVLVVGGGDSAIEAAATLAALPGTDVKLSYRGETITRIKPRNREVLAQAERAGRLAVLLGSQIMRITPEQVELEQGGQAMVLPNDAVIVCAGGVLPTPMLRDVGVRIETKYGTA